MKKYIIIAAIVVVIGVAIAIIYKKNASVNTALKTRATKEQSILNYAASLGATQTELSKVKTLLATMTDSEIDVLYQSFIFYKTENPTLAIPATLLAQFNQISSQYNIFT